ncbi:hypothetical protein GYMLUDRAFT_1024248 [Collybiopsis luxurians FD-317 M1]|uniref:Terpenoid synthase n=1 Tax=Collybiopsis luxurians FD-317 M1 TaxID=944289 RepID=A0A0D0CGU9_9AGAR|nr:hypothetical protein GYMLUDRAFT_1024248 [Collybiopsis luxurians FD-317 M1]
MQTMSVPKEEIASAMQSFLSRCSIVYRKVPIDPSFLELCYSEAKKRGYIAEGSEELKPLIPQGVAMAITAYAHLEDTSIRVWMTFITAAAIYCDDKFLKDPTSIGVFCERLLRGQPQEDRALDALADLLSVETPRIYPRITANLMVLSMLNLINAVLLDHQTLGMKVSAVADNYPMFTRIMSGVSELYGLAAFPPEVPVEAFIQALPSIMVFIVNANDILSFYKEELNGETVNYISLLAKSRGCEKRCALQIVIDETVEAHSKALRILDSDKAALDAYRSFASGYVEFHVALDNRYRLDELMLSCHASVNETVDG